MDLVLRGYHVNDATWLYLSALLIWAVYFKFGRFWSIRNLDLILLLLISPGLLLVHIQPAAGYVWLFSGSALLLVRVLLDSTFTRRPRLEQNMNAAGLTFLCAAAFAFLMTKVMTEPPPDATVRSVRLAHQLLQGHPVSETEKIGHEAYALSTLPTEVDVVAARSLAILGHLAVIAGLVLVGLQIFGDVENGVAMAAMYMLLPCTAFDVGKVHHVLPAALLVWAVWAYRRPIISGTLLGLACGMLVFPTFLLPVWAAFYGRRGAGRFLAAAACTVALMVCTALVISAWTSSNTQAFLRQTLGYIEWARLEFRVTDSSTDGFWRDHESAYRIPVGVAFLIMVIALTIWPQRKDLSTLLSSSVAIVIGTQFWYTQQGGVYILWYLPLLLLLMFRPVLTNHLAPAVRPFRWRLLRRGSTVSKGADLVISAVGGRPAFR